MRRSASLGRDRAKLHDVGCHIIHNACCGAGFKSQREVVVPAIVTDRLTEPLVDVDALGHAGLPHMRLDFTVVDAEALHYSSAMRKAQDTVPAAAKAEKTKENKYGKTKGGVGDTGIAMRLSGRFGPGLNALLQEACWVQSSNHQGSGKRRWTVTTGVAKTPERCAGQIHRCDNPLGHRA